MIAVEKKSSNVLVSFLLASKRPRLFAELVKNISDTTYNKKNIELLVLIDSDDDAMIKQIYRVSQSHGVSIKYLEHDERGYFNLWKGLNNLHSLCEPNATFVCNINDEIRFETFNWDLKLEKYTELFSDNIFRLRISNFKLWNYHDFWECGFAPENYAFTTKRWIDLQGNWNACHGPDSFQQFVSYYLSRIDQPANTQTNRDVPIFDIQISGEGMYVGLTQDEINIRIKSGWRAWYVLVSAGMQMECKRRACIIRGHIDASIAGLHDVTYQDDKRRNVITMISSTDSSTLFGNNGLPLTYGYGLNRFFLWLKNNWRKPAQDFYVGSEEFCPKLKNGERNYGFNAGLIILFFSILKKLKILLNRAKRLTGRKAF